jgi:predicted metal-dependent peptidase
LEGKCAEEIYDWLLKEQKKNTKNSNFPLNGSFNGNNTHDNGNDNGGDNDDSKSQKSNKKLSGQFDRHVYLGDESENEDAFDNITLPTDQWGEIGFDDDFRPQVSSDYSEKMREVVISAAQQTERQQGHLPLGIDHLLTTLKKPEINWCDELCNFVTSCYGGERQWLPPNRRYVYNDTYFQSRRSQQLNVAVCIDTSGSCIADLPKFFGELKGLVETFGQYTIHLIQCDARVSKYDIYDDCNPLELDIETDICWAGGGGTSFVPPFEYIENNDIDVDCIIYLTDGYGDAPKYPPKVDTLWIIVKDGCMDFCDWGKKIQFKESSF